MPVGNRRQRGTVAGAARRRQSGAAVITALLVVTLAVVVVAGLFMRESVTVRSVENRMALSQTRWIERAALDWACVILRADVAASGGVDHLGEPWAVPVAETRLDETVTAGARISDSTRPATLSGQIVDAQSRFNLAGLVQGGQVSQPHLLALRRLLALLGLPDRLADQARLRIQSGQPVTVGDRVVPATELPVVRLDDLMRLPGFDAATIETLRPFAIVLPVATPVNVNTAPAEVLAALVPGIELAGARRFVARRERAWFRTVEEAGLAFDGQPVLPQAMLAVGSSYFLVRGVIRFDRVEAASDTLLSRNAQKIEILWQQRY